ncbi:MAG: esterase, partial [Bacteroidales bacterium]|nr:esterase [Bacteroidales bacterium]
LPYGNMLHGTPNPATMDAVPMYQQFTRVLTNEIMPFVAQNFRTKNDRESRAIAGFSRGGGQSQYAAFSNPDKFANMGSFSSYLIPESMDKEFSSLMTKENMKKNFKVLWYGVGKDDFLYKNVQTHLDYFKQKGIDYKYKETDGGHTWMNARDYLAEVYQLLFK